MNPHRPNVPIGFASTLSGIVMLTLMTGDAVAQLMPDNSLGGLCCINDF